MKALSCLQQFPHYMSMVVFGCHGNQTFDPICPKVDAKAMIRNRYSRITHPAPDPKRKGTQNIKTA